MNSDQLQALLLAEEESGFSVTPKEDCPHISSDSFTIHKPFVTPPTESTTSPSSSGKSTGEKTEVKNIYTEKRKCSVDSCVVDEEVWVCLRCGLSACGRFKNKHMLEHGTDQSSSSCAPVIAMSLADLSTWCFACDDYITHPKLELPFQELHNAKIGYYPQASLHGPSPIVLHTQ